MLFGEKLKKLREDKKLSQIQLAYNLGVSKSTVSCYENGSRYPSYEVLVKIAHTFHVTTDYLLDHDSIRTLDVSDLLDEDIEILKNMADMLRRKNEQIKEK